MVSNYSVTLARLSPPKTILLLSKAPAIQPKLKLALLKSRLKPKLLLPITKLVSSTNAPLLSKAVLLLSRSVVLPRPKSMKRNIASMMLLQPPKPLSMKVSFQVAVSHLSTSAKLSKRLTQAYLSLRKLSKLHSPKSWKMLGSIAKPSLTKSRKPKMAKVLTS